jgi:uncharacterized protein involved in exopolysaccharide biosynthesis
MPARPYQLTGIFFLLLKWRKPLVVLVAAAALLSAGIAFLLPNEYQSTAVFYPTDLNDINAEQLLRGSRAETPELFGTTEDIDRMLTIAYSQPLADHIIRKFDLARHYGSDTTHAEGRQEVVDEFLSNFEAEHTERDAIAITFRDRDKHLAAAVANAITARIGQLNQQLIAGNRQEVLHIYNKRNEFLRQQYHRLRDSLQQSRRRFRIFGSARDTHESRYEARYLARQLVQTETELRQARAEAAHLQRAGQQGPHLTALQARIKGLEQAFTALSSARNGNLINYETYLAGTDVVAGLEAQLQGLQQEFIKSQKAYINAQVALEGELSSIYVVQKAYPALKKAWPIRWLIVAGATVLTFLLAVLVIVLLENHRPVPARP